MRAALLVRTAGGTRLSMVVALGACAAPPTSATHAPPPAVSLVAHPEPAVLLPDGRIAVRSIVVTDGSTCALLADASVWCWGKTYTKAHGVLVEQVQLPPVAQIVASAGSTYARTEAGDVLRWGEDPRRIGLDPPEKIAGPGVIEVAAGANDVCLRWADKTECRSAADTVVTPLPAPASAIAAGRWQMCAATAEGVTCESPARTQRVALADVVQLAASSTLMCARAKDGSVTCLQGDELRVETRPFGDGPYVALEASDDAVCARPLRGATSCVREHAEQPDDAGALHFEEAMREHKGATSVSLAALGGCFVDAGVAWGWGPPAPGGAAEPTAIDLGDLASLASAREIATGEDHVCVLGTDDAVRCFGLNSGGALGVGDARDRLGPERVAGLPKIARVAAGGDLTCAITKPSPGEEGGRLFCWGALRAQRGQRCQGASGIECSGAPTLVTTGVASVAIGDGFACALDAPPPAAPGAGAGVRCWGENTFGQLGAGDFERSKTPRVVVDASGAALTGATQIAAGRFHVTARLADGSVVAWGYDDPGSQGRAVDPSRPSRDGGAARPVATPVPMPGPIAEVSAQCARTEAGETWCWGRHPNGDFSVVPARVGVCHATSLRDDCVLDAERVACASNGPLFTRSPPYAGPAIASWALSEDRSCVVDVEHRATCRLRRAVGAPEFGAGGPPLDAFSGSSACPMDPPKGEGPLLVRWAHSFVSASGTTRPLDDEEIRGLAAAWASGPPATCATEEVTAQLEFDDVAGRPRVVLWYIGPPCDALQDRLSRGVPTRALGPAGRATIRRILAETDARRDR